MLFHTSMSIMCSPEGFSILNDNKSQHNTQIYKLQLKTHLSETPGLNKTGRLCKEKKTHKCHEEAKLFGCNCVMFSIIHEKQFSWNQNESLTARHKGLILLGNNLKQKVLSGCFTKGKKQKNILSGKTLDKIREINKVYKKQNKKSQLPFYSEKLCRQ